MDGVAVQLEGPILLATGHYRIELSCSGCEPMVRDIDVAAGQQLDLHVELALVGASVPAAPSQTSDHPATQQPPAARAPTPARPVAHSGPSVAVLIAGSATLALLASAGTFAVLTQQELSSLRERCTRTGCTRQTRDELWQSSPIETYETITNVALVAFALGAATTAALWIHGDEHATTSEPRVSVSAQGAALSLTARF